MTSVNPGAVIDSPAKFIARGITGPNLPATPSCLMRQAGLAIAIQAGQQGHQFAVANDVHGICNAGILTIFGDR
jgi:hypothetical protein